MKKNRDWRESFNQIIRTHNQYNASGAKVVSYATQNTRRTILFQGLKDLRSMGYKFKTVLGFRGKHMQCLVHDWEQKRLSAATIQNRVSIFKIFADWIGKEGMVKDAVEYVSHPDVVKRHHLLPVGFICKNILPPSNNLTGRSVAVVWRILVFVNFIRGN